MDPREKFLDDLAKNVYCRLRPSKIHGVGVFAIRPVPHGVNPFQGCRPVKWRLLPEAELDQDAGIHPAVKAFAKELYAVERGMLHYPDHGLNDVNISYFVNHSSVPNLEVIEYEDRIEFVASRSISAGEELTADYAQYVAGE